MMRPGPPCLGVSGLPAFAEASVDRGVSGMGNWRLGVGCWMLDVPGLEGGTSEINSDSHRERVDQISDPDQAFLTTDPAVRDG